MATDTRTESYLKTLEFVYDKDTKKKHYVHPMLSNRYIEVQDLFKKINIEYIIGNYPHPLMDAQMNLILSEDGEEIIDIEAFTAMQELLEITLNEPWEVTNTWITIRQIEEVLSMFQCVSGLLIKKRELEMAILTSGFSVQA
jgi:hypothetical protein